MQAKFNLDTMSGIANFENAAKGMARDLYNAAFFDKPSATADDMYDYMLMQDENMDFPHGADENAQPLAFTNDPAAARSIFVRVAEDVLENSRD